jgi:O-antigen/teichoic acid export membrane protein
MDDLTDEKLKRLFATAAVVEADPAFVTAVSREVAIHRQRRRIRTVGMLVLAALLALALAVLLAPFAPVVDGSFGLSLLQLPERLDDAASLMIGRLAPISPFVYLTLAACVLPLAGTAWLVRRS